MKNLVHIAFSKAKYRWILVVTLLFALGFTVATQLEMFSLGVVTMKGPDFFDLFGEKKGSSSVRYDDVLNKWKEIDASNSGVITKDDVSQFLAKKPRGIVDKGLSLINEWIPVKKNVWALVGFLIIVSSLKAITLFGYKFGTKLFTIYIGKDLRQRYFEHIQLLPMSFYQAHNIGGLSARTTTDAYVIADGINSALVNYIQTPFAVISTLGLCFAISWQLSCVVFLGIPLLIGPIIFIARRIKRLSKQLQTKQEAFSSVLVEYLRGVQTIKLYAMEDFSLKKYQEHNDAMAHLEIRSARYDISSRPVLHAIGMVFLVTALLFGLWGLLLPLHEVLFFCALLIAVYEPLKKFAEDNGRIQRGMAASERLHEVLELCPSIQDDSKAKTTISFEESLNFKDVTFSYDDKPVLSSVSFSVKKGEMVAIIGSTGGGKSTTISLLTRLFEPQQGTITIDAVPIQEYTQKALREFFAVVPQRPFLFHDTVAENIRYGRTYTDEEVRRAARFAHAEEFILKLPQQYDSFLAEAGKTLSGGQQQRIAIARALIKNSPILVLDEATSSLDTASEQHIKSILRELKGNITQIVIAHRLSTIEDADRIIVLEEGRKVGDGTKDALLESCPAFQRLWQPYVQHDSYSVK